MEGPGGNCENHKKYKNLKISQGPQWKLTEKCKWFHERPLTQLQKIMKIMTNAKFCKAIKVNKSLNILNYGKSAECLTNYFQVIEQ